MPRPKKDLTSVRDIIETQFDEGQTYNQILNDVNDLLLAQGAQIVSLCTLKSQISAWSLVRNSTVSLDPWYEEISEPFLSDVSIPLILQIVNESLHVRNSQPISRRTLERQLYQWDLSYLTIS